MPWFGFISSTTSESHGEGGSVITSQTTAIAVQGDPEPRRTSAVAVDSPGNATTFPLQGINDSASDPKQSKEARHFSFQSLVFKKQVLSPTTQGKTQESSPQNPPKENASRSEKRALKSALLVRTMIVGPTSAGPKMTAAVAKPELKKVKSQMLEPKKANELINQLRKLPAQGEASQSNSNGPIHAVCLSLPDEEEAALLFEKLAPSIPAGDVTTLFALPGVVAAPLDKLAEMYKEMKIIDLVTTTDLGLGQPGDGNGLLAGAVPTAETVIRGFEQVTPQLMALGFATGKLVVPDHTGILTADTPPCFLTHIQESIPLLTGCPSSLVRRLLPCYGQALTTQHQIGGVWNFFSLLHLYAISVLVHLCHSSSLAFANIYFI